MFFKTGCTSTVMPGHLYNCVTTIYVFYFSQYGCIPQDFLWNSESFPYFPHLSCTCIPSQVPQFLEINITRTLVQLLTHPLSSCWKPFSWRDMDHLSAIFLQRYCHLLQCSITTVGAKYLCHYTGCLETSIAS
jgi:hypothetical protein